MRSQSLQSTIRILPDHSSEYARHSISCLECGIGGGIIREKDISVRAFVEGQVNAENRAQTALATLVSVREQDCFAKKSIEGAETPATRESNKLSFRSELDVYHFTLTIQLYPQIRRGRYIKFRQN